MPRALQRRPKEATKKLDPPKPKEYPIDFLIWHGSLWLSVRTQAADIPTHRSQNPSSRERGMYSFQFTLKNFHLPQQSQVQKYWACIWAKELQVLYQSLTHIKPVVVQLSFMNTCCQHQNAQQLLPLLLYPCVHGMPIHRLQHTLNHSRLGHKHLSVCTSH